MVFNLMKRVIPLREADFGLEYVPSLLRTGCQLEEPVSIIVVRSRKRSPL